MGLSPSEADPGMRSRYAEAKLCPDPMASTDAFLEMLIREAKGCDALPVLIPTSDAFVVCLSQNQPKLEKYCRFNIPDPEAALNINDKRRQHRIACALGIPVPRTFSPASAMEAADVGAQLRYPAFIKPVFTFEWPRHFSGKGFEVHDTEELQSCYERIWRAGVAAVAQEVIPGPQESGLRSICLYGRQGTGEIVAAFGMRKIRQCPPDYGVGTLVESCHDSGLLELAGKFYQGCRCTGVAEIEFKRDERDGCFKLIELNARLWTQTALAAACGVDFAYLLYADLTGAPLPLVEDYRDGIRWLDLLSDIYRCKHYHREYPVGLPAWLRSIRGVRAFSTFAPDDPRPFMASAWRQARSAVAARWNSARTR